MLSTRKKKKRPKRRITVSLKWHSLSFFEFIYLLAYVPFFFFFFFAHCHPTCLHAHTGISKHCQSSLWEGERKWETVSKGERSRSWDALWVSPLNEAQHGTPSAELLFKACFALVLSTFGIGKERGWCSFWAVQGRNTPFSSVCVLFKLRTCVPNWLFASCITYTFYFYPVLLSFILLTSHFLLVSFPLSPVFTLTSSHCLHWFAACANLHACMCMCHKVRWAESQGCSIRHACHL